MTVIDHDGAGTPISAWAGRGSSGENTGGNMATQLREEEETAANATALQETRPPRRHMPVNTLCVEGWDLTHPHSQRLWQGGEVVFWRL